jgi:hypothetical protein
MSGSDVRLPGDPLDGPNLAELAQRMLDLHPIVLHGRCLTCGAADCTTRRAATVELRRYKRLPKRRPGLTRPELLGLRRAF